MAFRQALEAVPMMEREDWLDRELGIEDPLPADGGRLPADGVPYLPCSVANLLTAVDGAAIGVDDVVVDLGSGLGRACAFIHRWAGAETIGVEVQPQLVALAQAMSQGEQGMTWLQGEAAQLVPTMTRATVFFLYCPFSGRRLEQVLASIEELATRRTVRLILVGMAQLTRSGWRALGSRSAEVDIYVSEGPRQV